MPGSGTFFLAACGPAGVLLRSPPSSLPLALAMNPLETDKCGAEFRGRIELRMDGIAQMLDDILDKQIQQTRDGCIVVPEAAGVRSGLQCARRELGCPTAVRIRCYDKWNA